VGVIQLVPHIVEVSTFLVLKILDFVDSLFISSSKSVLDVQFLGIRMLQADDVALL